MTRKVISYFNKDLKFYEHIKLVENQDNQNIIGSCRRYLGMCPISEAPNCVGRKIVIIGEFHDEEETHSLYCYDAPVLVVDCDEILLARFPQLYESEARS